MKEDIAGRRVRVRHWIAPNCVKYHDLRLVVGLCGEAGRTTKAGLVIVSLDHGVQVSIPRSLLEIID